MKIRAIDIGAAFEIQKNEVKEYATEFYDYLFSFVDEEDFIGSLYIILV